MKLYGSDVSLNLHIKIKHNGGNKTERENLAVNFFIINFYKIEIISAQDYDESKPHTLINFPPGYLEVYIHLIFFRK